MPSLLYQIIKIPARLVIKIYCKSLKVQPPEALQFKGPLLIACNHPNSFLDAIIITTLFKQPVHSLARGDVFKKKWMAFIFKNLNMLPVYRTREGVENLENNYKSFEACEELFKKNGVVLIFSEGLCINEWHLRNLMKGTARLALSSWEQNIPLQILPTGINYNSFRSFGKKVTLNFGKPFSRDDISLGNGFGKDVANFNAHLKTQMQPLILELPEKSKLQDANEFFSDENNLQKKLILFIPGIIGFIIHAPYYFPLKIAIKKWAGKSGHFDSLFVGISFFTYPLYLFLVSGIGWYFLGYQWGIITFLLLPFLAYAAVQIKKD